MARLVRFGSFELDLETADLRNNGRRSRLPEQQFRLLRILLERNGSLVSREEIRRQLWPNDTVVEFDRSINAAIMKLRITLGDTADKPAFIETLARRGYRFLVHAEFDSPVEVECAFLPMMHGSLVGTKILHYRVLEVLGGGGMGLVYRGEDLHLNRPVALKFLPEEVAQDSIALRRLEREARTASSLNHPNICTIYQVEEHNGQPFIVMELLEGQSLRELISRYGSGNNASSHLPLEQLLQIGIQITDGLDAAHQRGIIHRDIKPANIFLTPRGQVKILDFGLAKVAMTAAGVPSDAHEEDPDVGPKAGFRGESSIEHSLSRTGIAMGTAGYMSPEQVRGEKLDVRTDLFSFGLVLFEMATGQRAFSGDTAALVQDAILHRTLPPARELNLQLPLQLQEIIRKALEKDRELRYQTAAEMLVDLKSTLKTVQAAPPTDSVATSAALRDRSAVRAGTFIGGGLLLLLGAIGLLWWKYSGPSPRSEIKERQLTTNSSDNPIIGAAISGDGKYLTFGDNFGLHVRSLESGETRDIPNPVQFGDAHVFWSISWFPDSTRFLAVSNSFDNRMITWQASVMGGAIHKVRDDMQGWSVSPDGSSVAATKAVGNAAWLMRELWVMDNDGGHPQKLLEVGERGDLEGVRWSPDGTKLLYLRSEEYRDRRFVEIRDVKSGSSHVLLSNRQLRELYWLRDGHVVYALAEGGDERTCNYWIARIDQNKGAFASEARQLTHNSGFCVDNTSATADSKRLVFTKRSNLAAVYVADVEGGGTRITPPRHLSLTEGLEWPNGWTADSREVVFTSNRDEKWGIYRLPLGGGPVQPVLVEKTNDFGFPRPSPDGRWLLIERDPENKLLRVPMTGGQEELIAKDVYGTPSCAAPTTGLCAYSKLEKNQLTFMGFDPQLKQRTGLGSFTLDPDFKGSYFWTLSPDATEIAILETGTGNIYLLNVKTKALQRIIVKHWSNLVNMDWTADGKGLFMCGLRNGSVLLRVDLHGNAEVLWEAGGVSELWALPSPDGKHVAMSFFSANANVWMMENF